MALSSADDIALWDWQRLPEAFAPDVASLLAGHADV
jgi:hypothetical protein